MQTIEIDVQGMTCNACVNSVSRLLGAVAGVSGVKVSLEKKLASVEFDATATNAAALVEAIEDGGFDAAVK